MLTGNGKVLSEVINTPDGDTAKGHGGYGSACETLTSTYYSCADPKLTQAFH
jgi:hypothetical protein